MEREPLFMDKRLNIGNMSVLPNLIYRVHAVAVKIPGSHILDINKVILRLTWKDKRSRITNTILNEKNKLRDFKTYYKAMLIKMG